MFSSEPDPYHATATRPGLPVVSHGNSTRWFSWLLTCTGALQVSPASLEWVRNTAWSSHQVTYTVPSSATRSGSNRCPWLVLLSAVKVFQVMPPSVERDTNTAPEDTLAT